MAKWCDLNCQPATFSEVSVPAFYTTATEDIIMLPDTTWDWHKDGFRYAPPGDKYLLVLNGADHYLGGIVGRDDLKMNPRARDYLSLTNGLTTAFLSSYLKGQSGAHNHSFLDVSAFRKTC